MDCFRLSGFGFRVEGFRADGVIFFLGFRV